MCGGGGGFCWLQSQPAFAPKMGIVLDLMHQGITAILCCERVKSVLRRAAKSADLGAWSQTCVTLCLPTPAPPPLPATHPTLRFVTMQV